MRIDDPEKNWGTPRNGKNRTLKGRQNRAQGSELASFYLIVLRGVSVVLEQKTGLGNAICSVFRDYGFTVQIKGTISLNGYVWLFVV